MKLETKIKRACLKQIGFIPGSGLSKTIVKIHKRLLVFVYGFC